MPRSMMTHGAMLWGAALYNNGGFHFKDPRFGESYSESESRKRCSNPRPKKNVAQKACLNFSIHAAMGDLAAGKRVARV